MPQSDPCRDRLKNRRPAESISLQSHECQSCRCGEFGLRPLDTAAEDQPVPPGQLQHSRNRNRQHTMGRGHSAPASRWGLTQQGADLQMLQGSAHPYHIHKAVNGSHFVEVNAFGVGAMHRRFGLSKSFKHRKDPLAQRLRQGGAADAITQLTPVPMGRLRLGTLNDEPQATQTAAGRLLNPEAVGVSQSKPLQRLVDDRLRNAKIQTGRQQHISSETGRTVHEQRGHATSGSRPSNSRSATASRSSR